VSGVDVKTTVERVIGVVLLLVAALGPQLFNDFWLDAILTQALLLGIAAASLIFLSAYGGMVSLAQTALMGIAWYTLGNMVTQRGPGGETSRSSFTASVRRAACPGTQRPRAVPPAPLA